jgi:hypothetical protein
MMNIIEFLKRNNTKSNNKIKILDILGFESDIPIETSTYTSSNNDILEFENEITFENLIETTQEPVQQKTSVNSTIDEYFAADKIDKTPTDTFNPLNITQQIQKVWSDLESRRKWVGPLFIGSLVVFTIFIGINTFLNVQEEQTQIVEETIAVTTNSNELIELLPTLIEISTNTFYSKYDVSNASANLQQIESSLIQYRSNLESRNDVDLETVNQTLIPVFQLVNELDLVITYRILNSEILIYGDLPTSEEDVDIDRLTLELSDIIAKSKVNYDQLPDIEEFQNHKNLVNIAIATAEDLHGRYLGALRNNEYEVAASIATAIKLNKETELNAFENSLEVFNENAIVIYDNFSDLP